MPVYDFACEDCGAEGAAVAEEARVAAPDHCVVLCDKCAGFCAVDAITFPDKDQMKAYLQQLVRERQAREVAHD